MLCSADYTIWEVRAQARQFYDAGYNVIPVRLGSKAPGLRAGTPYLYERMSWASVEWAWANPQKPYGIAVVCGDTSGGHEVLDFDYRARTIYPFFRDKLKRKAPGILDRLPIVMTPKPGVHLHYLCPEARMEVGRKLAQECVGQREANLVRLDKVETLIETRNLKHICVLPGGPLQTHASGKPYRVARGDLCDLPVLTLDERNAMLAVAESFNLYVSPSTDAKRKAAASSRTPDSVTTKWVTPDLGDRTERPGDAFNRKATWPDILEPVGWRIERETHGVRYWTRPDKTGGVSASTGHGDGDFLYVFSSSAAPFEPARGYSKFSAYALLHHGGNFYDAASELASQGMGTPFKNIDNLLETL